MRRLSLIFLPFLAAFALVFGLYYLYAAYRLVQMGRVMSAGLVFVFGVMGVGLAVGIWIARKRVGGRGGSTPASSGKPAA
jgi:predicted PurR-regulated permease PerM